MTKQPQPETAERPTASLRESPRDMLRLAQTRSPSRTVPCAVPQQPMHLRGSHSRPASKQGQREVPQLAAQEQPAWRLLHAGLQRHQRSQKL